MSKAGMALLYTSCGGTPTQSMLDLIAKQESNNKHGEALIKKAREKWDEHDARETGQAQAVCLGVIFMFC